MSWYADGSDYYTSDPQVKAYISEERHDLLPGANPPTKGASEYIIFEDKAPKNQVLIIKAFAPYLMRRINIGDPALESVEFIDPKEVNGFFSFSPLVNDQSPFIIKSNVNAMRSAGGALDDDDRVKPTGISHSSSDPVRDTIFYPNDPVFNIHVPGDATFQIIMTQLRLGSTNPIPNGFTIGGSSSKRVDFAGVQVYGVTMPESLYNNIINKKL